MYGSLGLSVGATFSSEDVSVLFSKVFHTPSNNAAAHVAMERVRVLRTRGSFAFINTSFGMLYVPVRCFGVFRLQEKIVTGVVLVKMCWMFSWKWKGREKRRTRYGSDS